MTEPGLVVSPMAIRKKLSGLVPILLAVPLCTQSVTLQRAR